jgi:histidine triad (HIT) family protein
MKSCIFCQIATGKTPAEIVLENNDALAFLDHRPLQYGHVLFIPKTHIVTFDELPPEQTGDFFKVAQSLSLGIERAMKAEGTFLAINNKVSQSVPHLHLHIVPRTKGDGLKGFFWPRKKYSGEELAETGAKIREALR